MRIQACLVALAMAVVVSGQDAAKSFKEGLRAYAAEDYERAMRLFEQAVQAKPDDSQYHLWLGRAAGRRAEHVFFTRAMSLAKKVGASFERAIELDPSNVAALTDLLEFYLQAPGMVGGGVDKAPAIAAKLAKLSPAEGHRAQALILAKRKDFAGAEKEYRQAMELEPKKVSRILDLASFLAERGRIADADALFDRAAQIAPNSPEYLFARGKQLVLSKRNPVLARELLERYLKSDRQPDDPPPSEVRELLKKIG